MINPPTTVCGTSFQLAWKDALRTLSVNGWELYNLVVQIQQPAAFDASFHATVEQFAAANSLLGPKHVAYTIFPYQLYAFLGNGPRLHDAYNRDGGFYERLRRRSQPGWGTYFRRMTYYQSRLGIENQLENVVNAINARSNVHKACYTILIPHPGKETTRALGGPCLNFLAVQMQATTARPLLGIMCVYRNHDFIERAYGNYWGLCNLAHFMSRETGSGLGPVTVISSHAYVDRFHGPIRQLLPSLPDQ